MSRGRFHHRAAVSYRSCSLDVSGSLTPRKIPPRGISRLSAAAPSLADHIDDGSSMSYLLAYLMTR